MAQGRKVGLTAQSHKVIHNLLAEIERAAAEECLEFKGIKRGDHWESKHIKTNNSIDAVLDPEVTLVAGTAWLFARDELDGKLDTLVVDEAGQYSLADTIACGTAARRLVRSATRPTRPGDAGFTGGSVPALSMSSASTGRSRNSWASSEQTRRMIRGLPLHLGCVHEVTGPPRLRGRTTGQRRRALARGRPRETGSTQTRLKAIAREIERLSPAFQTGAPSARSHTTM